MHKMTLLAAIVGALLSSTASAQEFQPLSEYIERPPEDQVSSYIFERCAGLYQGILAYNPTRMTDEVSERFEQSIAIVALVAVKLREKASITETPPDVLTNSTANDIVRIAEIYLDRIKNNYATTGQAFADDALITGDLDTCRQITEIFRGIIPPDALK
ncbi:hypothetical protein L1787_16600 [Acuticoccus sp. M5D2P5]|uniref:hypothetical protein n=1 Tax=Acuticoccus kalidii TaxID=2910977 RepID=UPI001F353E2A|nr:hypothetical protein [Acuticoccus kalidii]MCF3935026.1 hypothetical protein [Acuticoccus kalidii]